MFTSSVLLVAMVAAPGAAADKYTEAFQQAEKLAAADQFGEAEPLYQSALATDDRFLKRQVYTRLMTLYVRSGRPDKAIQLATPFRKWLKEVGDTESVAGLELLVGQCQLDLGYNETAEKHLIAALDARPPLTSERMLEALRLRAEVAIQMRSPKQKAHWETLEKAAAEVLKQAEKANDSALRIAAGRYLAEALFRRGDIDGALAALAPFPELHDKLLDPLGRRETQRQRAKLLAAKGRYSDASALFKEALAIHRKQQPKRRLIAGDILAEWSGAALAAGKLTEGAQLRDEAVIEYKAALDSPSDNPDAGGPLTAFVRLQLLTRSARQFRQALDINRTAGDRWSGDPLLDGRLKSDRGGLELMTSAYQTARKLLRQSLTDLDAADPPNLRMLPKVLVNLATAELGCDSPERADELLRRCSDLYRRHKLPADAVRVECDYLLGVSAAQRGDFAGAMKHFRAGLALCEIVGTSSDPVRFNLWLNIALIHKEQGDAVAAQESLKKASAVLALFTEPDDLSAALIDAVRIDLYLAQGQITPAATLVSTLESACAKHGQKGGYLWSTARHVRALELLARKDIPGAEAIWVELADTQRKEGNVLLARTLNFLGICAELRGNADDARKRFEEANDFQTNHPRCPPVTRAITLWRLAVLTDKAGRKDEAKKLLLQVFEVADRARINTFGEAAQRAQFFAQFAPAFELLALWYARDGDGEGVLRVIVRSRSRTLLDQMLTAGVDPRDQLTGDLRTKLLLREANARRAISRLRSQAMLIAPDQMNDPAAKKLLAELEAAQKEFADTWREIANADPLTRVLTDPAFAETSLAQVRKEVHTSGGVLLTYMIGRDESLAVLSTDPTRPPQVFRLTLPRPISESIGDIPAGDAVASTGLRGVVIKSNVKQPERPAPIGGALVPLSDVVVARLVNHYLRQIADPSFNPTRGIAIVSKNPSAGPKPATAELLGDVILPPALLTKIRESKAKRLVLIPDGALHKLPFEALLLSNKPAPKYALDELPPICYAPSIPVLAVVLKRERFPDAEPSLLTVGDPAYPEVAMGTSPGGALPRLPFTATESRKVRQFFPIDRITALERADATEAKFVAALRGKRFVHLAAHGFADDAFGNAFAAVALAPGRGSATPDDDGFLTLHEISRLKLTGCELTVLSACVTNVGPQRPLEAGVTLAGAFFSAGSRGVMASCWSVDDKATAELMGEVFGAIRPANGKPVSAPEALKRARLAVRSKPGWEAPFYWAPFVYLGPPD
ncbi:MAG: CHAT domain-containing protein [Planctomycetia bacterium]|nr:CHAT domain-containing protein [Planctomycetia bacterium]